MKRTTILVAGLAGALALAGSLTALGSTRDTMHEVHAGESIQAAIDAARPGDTVVVAPGTYRENLTITKDRIALRGAGAAEGGTVLVAPATPHESPCNESGEVNGICIAGQFELGTERVGTPVHGVHVSDLAVRGFSRFGVVVYNAVDTTVAGVDTARNHRYGLVAFSVEGIGVRDSRSHDNGQGGFYIGDAPDANVLFERNAAFRNAESEGIGLFLRDAAQGIVRDNRLEGNCAGMLLVDTARDGSLSGWDVRDNTVTRNTAPCPPSEDVPVPLSGVGIGLLGTEAVTVVGNTVTANRPSADTMIAGGIVLASAHSVGGADPEGTVVRSNTSRGNGPADIAFDGSGTTNRFSDNRCGTSLPNGLCG